MCDADCWDTPDNLPERDLPGSNEQRTILRCPHQGWTLGTQNFQRTLRPQNFPRQVTRHPTCQAIFLRTRRTRPARSPQRPTHPPSLRVPPPIPERGLARMLAAKGGINLAFWSPSAGLFWPARPTYTHARRGSLASCPGPPYSGNVTVHNCGHFGRRPLPHPGCRCGEVPAARDGYHGSQ